MSAFDLSERRVVVTGASSGIGEGIARAFSRAGARVAGISLEGDPPVEGIFVHGDTGDREAVEGLAARPEGPGARVPAHAFRVVEPVDQNFNHGRGRPRR